MFEMIVDHVAPPAGDEKEPFLMQVSTIFYDDYVGRQACGRIRCGQVTKGQTVMHVDRSGNPKRCQVTRIEGHVGLEKREST